MGALGTARGARTVAEAWKTARDLEREQEERERIAQLPKVTEDGTDEATIAVLEPESPAHDTADADPADAQVHPPATMTDAILAPPTPDAKPEPSALAQKETG